MSAPSVGVTAPSTGRYAELTALVRQRGLLETRTSSYVVQAVGVLAVLSGTVAAMVVWRQSWWLLVGALVLAATSTQLGFLGHDVSHQQVTRNRRSSRRLGLATANLLGGLSYGWWIAKHNAHHAHPNDLSKDPDVRTGVLVFDSSQARVRRGFAAWTTRHQAALFFPLLLGEAVNLHVASIRWAWSAGAGRSRATERALLATHVLAYGTLLATTLTWPQAIAFFAVHKAVQGLYLGCAFAPNHKGMPVLGPEQAADPLLRQVLTSRNIRGGPFTDALLGGLNYQIEHHLFPSMPRANLRHAQPLVRQYCQDHGIPYLECSAVTSYAAALRHLDRVGASALS